MDFLINALHKGGPFMWPVLLFFVLSGIGVVAMTAASLKRVRVPALAWWFLPLGMAVVGVLGTVQGQLLLTEAMEFAGPDDIEIMASAGHATSLFMRAAGHVLAMPALVFGAVGLGVASAARPGAEPRATPRHGLAAGAVVLLGGIVATLNSAFSGISIVYPLTVSLPGALAAALVGLRWSEADADRLAENRLAAAVCLIGAAVCGGLLLNDQGLRISLEASAHASAAAKPALTAAGDILRAAGRITAAILTAATLIGGGLLVVPVARHVARLRTLVSLALLGLGGVVWVGLMVRVSQLLVWRPPL